MTCVNPMTAWRSIYVHPVSGKNKLAFKFHPTETVPGSELKLPCGGCIGCRIDKSRQWMLRLMHESKQHTQKSFLTLTYSDLNLPPQGNLRHRDFQLFMKKLRKETNGIFKKEDPKYITLRYFMCGEYGDTTGRPHYHVILYGCDFADRKKHSKGSQGDQLWTSPTLDRIWGLGDCYIGNVTHESCGYVARYVMKKVNGALAEEHYSRVDESTGEYYLLTPEYIRCSNRSGIGKQHYEEYKDDLYPSDFAISKGNKLPVPKYYDRLLEREDPELLETLKQRRKERAEENSANNTRARLDAKKQILQSKIRQLKRQL